MRCSRFVGRCRGNLPEMYPKGAHLPPTREYVREAEGPPEDDADDWGDLEPPSTDEDWETLERNLLDAFDDDELEPELDELGWRPPTDEQDDF